MEKNKGSPSTSSNKSFNEDNLTREAEIMYKLQNAVREQVARFRPPFTPSNSLLPQTSSPPIIKVTPAIPQFFEFSKESNLEEEEKLEELNIKETNINQQQQNNNNNNTKIIIKIKEMPRPSPQPFPIIPSHHRRRASTTTNNNSFLPSSYSFNNFNNSNNIQGNRNSLPRLSITSLGSVAKTFSGLAAFIVPEEQSDKERFRELRIASQRRASLAFNNNKTKKINLQNNSNITTINDNLIDSLESCEEKTSSSECSFRQRNKNITESKIHTKMRSCSVKPIPRSQAFNNNNPSIQNNKPIQNGNGGMTQHQRNISRNRSATITKQNGGSNASGLNRAPSMPPRIINRRYAHVKSKVNSITDYSPTPSEIKIFHEPLKVNAASKVGSLVNADHIAAGGNVRILQTKLNFRETARPKVDAKSDLIIPKSEKRIPTEKLVWKAESKIGSLVNAGHVPGGGQNKIFNEPVKVVANAKVGSLDNVTHVPGGGNVKISDYSRSISGTGSVRSRRNTGDSLQSPSTLNADIDSINDADS